MPENASSPPPVHRRRAKLILLLSIASYSWALWLLFLYVFFERWDMAQVTFLLIIICFFLALIANIMAWYSHFDKSSKRLARAGATLGIVSIFLLPLGILSLFGAPDTQTPKDAMINDMYNFASQAYHYRVRPKQMGGGAGSYLGFALPRKMVTNENGSYYALVAADTLKITGMSLDAKGFIVSYVDSSGMIVKWIYGGKYQE